MLISETGQPRQGPSDAFTWAWLALLAVIMAFICMYRADSWDFHFDEYWHIHIASGASLADVWRYSLLDTHPPLSYILLHYWMMISRNPTFLRCMPLATGLALIPIYYGIGLRMNGRTAGLCCATLIAFSPGCINQSYQLRQYCLLLLFISLNFYAYLCWRRNRSLWTLLGYVLSGWLASFSHFSAIFYSFLVAVPETILLLRNRNIRTLLEWISANLLIADLYLFLYDRWQYSVLIWSSFHVYRWNPASLQERIDLSLSAPLLAAEYIFLPLPMLLLFWLGVFLLRPTFRKEAFLRFYVALTAMACLLSAALYFFNVYPTLGERHSLWILPFFIPTAGCLIADTVKQGKARGRAPISALLAVTLFFALAALYQRFADTSEYWDIMNGSMQAVEQTLGTFGPRDVIVTNKPTATWLVNTYRYSSDEAFIGNRTATLVPYENAKFLLSPFNLGRLDRLPDPDDKNADAITERDFLSMMRQAQNTHVLDATDRLVLMGVGKELAHCPLLPEKTVIYPMLNAKNTAKPNGAARPGFGLLVIPTRVFLKDVLSPSGKAHACLN